jgi:hypothetical protein
MKKFFQRLNDLFGVHLYVLIDTYQVGIDITGIHASLNAPTTQDGKKNTSSTQKGFMIVVHLGWKLFHDFMNDLSLSANPFQERLGILHVVYFSGQDVKSFF